MWGREVYLRRVGESAVRVWQPVLHRRSREPVPIQGLLLRHRNRLVLSQRQILRPQRRQVPVSRYHPRHQRRFAGVQSLRLLQQQSCYVCRSEWEYCEFYLQNV